MQNIYVQTCMLTRFIIAVALSMEEAILHPHTSARHIFSMLDSSTEWISFVAQMHNRLVAVFRGNTRLIRIQAAQMVRRNTCAKNKPFLTNCACACCSFVLICVKLKLNSGHLFVAT